MKEIIAALEANQKVTDYKINESKKESSELFFVKGRLETVRATDVKDVTVTVYVDHGGCKGDASFPVYPSTTPADLERLVDEAAEKALLIQNEPYTLPENDAGDFAVESNFEGHSLSDLAETIARAVFSADRVEHSALNAVEIFVNRYTVRVRNSRGVDKTQTRYTAMVEAIPTYNGEQQSVELYQQLNSSSLDEDALKAEIAGKLKAVKARYEAVRPETMPECPVILNKGELEELFGTLTRQLNYSTVYSKSNLFRKGDAIQKDPAGDKITLTMLGEAPGCVTGAKFDADGLPLGSVRLIEDGVAVNYYGANRYGQYLGEKPTGILRCIQVEPGTACEKCLSKAPSLEVISMSGLQVDPFNDYIGGEVRLAYYNDGEKITPLTGISIAGKLSEVLSTIRLARATAVHDSYTGPAKAILQGMKVF